MHIGIDIGGSRVRVAWRPGDGSRTRTLITDSASLQDPRDWFANLLESLPVSARRVIDSGRLAGVGVGVPGEVRDPGIVIQSPNLPRWRKVAVGPDLERRLGVPVVVENDAHMAGVGLLAQPRLAGGRLRNVILLTLGTGVGGAWLLDGRLFRRSPGGEMEIGHCVVDPGGPRCSCGRRGCLEAYAGSRGLLRAWSERTGGTLSEVRELLALATGGDSTARDLLAEAGAALGRACAWMTNITSSGKFVFVGGVANARPWLLPTLRAAYREAAFPTHSRRTRFRFPATRETLGALGALHASEHRTSYRSPQSEE